VVDRIAQGVYVNNDSGRLLTVAVNSKGEGGDVAHVRTKPGTYALTINSSNVDWSVSVEDKR
jgi:hypothetical protein